MFINIQNNRHFRKLLTKQKYSLVVTFISQKNNNLMQNLSTFNDLFNMIMHSGKML